jgi:hypothetical protein
VHQPGIPTQRTGFSPGWGDCTVCTPDPFNNPNCAGYDYVQITVRTYDVISIEAAKNPD